LARWDPARLAGRPAAWQPRRGWRRSPVAAMPPANTLDIASFPTMAKYDMRADKEIDFKSAVESAKDENEHLLALIEQQTMIAEKKFRSGLIRQAIDILRRAYQIADTGAGHLGLRDVPGPARGMAKGLVRLHLCCALSSDGRHAEALSEARGAKRELDEVWKTMTGAAIEAEEAWDAGDMSRPAKHLSKMIKSPPSWTTRMVELAIQVRQALALELEFVHAPLPAGRREPGRSFMSEDAAGEQEAAREAAGEEAWCVGEGLAPVPKMTTVEEIQHLHMEAAHFARQLLPEGNPVRARAEKGHNEHGDRNKAVLVNRAARAQRIADMREISQAAFVGMAATDGFRKAGLGTSVSSTATTALPHADSVNSMQSSLMDATMNRSLDGNTPSLSTGDLIHMSMRSIASVGKRADSAGSMGKLRISRGDVFTYSASDLASHNRRLASALKSKKKMSPRSPASPDSRSPRGAANGEDPFTAWKKSTVDVGKLTLKQLKTRTDEGLKDLQGDLKLEKRRFLQVDLVALDEAEKLFDNRTLYSGFGALTAQKTERRKDAWRAREWLPSEKFLKRKEETTNNFKHYGISFATAEPSLRDYTKLMTECLDRNPGMIQHRQWEAQQRAAEDAERKAKEEAERLEVLKTKLSGMHLGKAGSGQTIFNFAA